MALVRGVPEQKVGFAINLDTATETLVGKNTRKKKFIMSVSGM